MIIDILFSLHLQLIKIQKEHLSSKLEPIKEPVRLVHSKKTKNKLGVNTKENPKYKLAYNVRTMFHFHLAISHQINWAYPLTAKKSPPRNPIETYLVKLFTLLILC